MYNNNMNSLSGKKLDLIDIKLFLDFFTNNGYVLDFSTKDFNRFTQTYIGIPLCQKYSSEYHQQVSKGKALEYYLKNSSIENSLQLLNSLMKYYENTHMDSSKDQQYQKIKRTLSRYQNQCQQKQSAVPNSSSKKLTQIAVMMSFHPQDSEEHKDSQDDLSYHQDLPFQIICDAAKSCNLKCIRADKFYSEEDTNDVAAKIRKLIQESLFTVVDLRGLNRNVLYELGYAQGYKRKTFLIIPQKDVKPLQKQVFDIRNQDFIKYQEDSPSSMTTLRNKLEINFKQFIGLNTGSDQTAPHF